MTPLPRSMRTATGLATEFKIVYWKTKIGTCRSARTGTLNWQMCEQMEERKERGRQDVLSTSYRFGLGNDVVHWHIILLGPNRFESQ
jgi:hypothetical protein